MTTTNLPRVISNLALAVVIALLAAACGNGDGAESSQGTGEEANGEAASGTDSEETGPISLGLLSDVSGPAAPCCGVPGRNGAELALDQLNDEGGIDGRPVEFVFYDTEGAKEAAVSGYRRLAGEDGVLGVVGPTRTDSVVALAPVADNVGVAFISTGSRGPFPGDFGDFAFRIAVSEEQLMGPFVERISSELGLESVAVIYASDDPAHVSGAEAFVETWESAGHEIVSEQTFTTGDTDFSAQVTAIKQASPDGVLIAAQVDDGGLLVAELEREGVDAQLMGIGGMASAEWFEVAGQTGAGLLTPSAFNPGAADAMVTDFVEAYEAEYGEAPGLDAAYGYTAANTLFEAVRRTEAELTPESLAETLRSFDPLESVVGTVEYNGPGDRVELEQILILEMSEEGEYVPWTP